MTGHLQVVIVLLGIIVSVWIVYAVVGIIEGVIGAAREIRAYRRQGDRA